MSAGAEVLVGIYIRISSDPEGLRAGVQRQLDDCMAFCERLGWVVVNVYEDNDVSAYSGKPRKSYLAMLEEIKAGLINTVVVWHPDRLHRHPIELEDFIVLIETTKVAVHSVTAGEYDLATSDGRLKARITGSVARKESEDKSRRMRRKKLALAQEGKPTGGARAFGYTKGGNDLVDAEAALIRQAAEDVLSGASMRSIAQRWNAQGVHTPKGHAWVPTVVRKLLMSPRAAGQRQHQGEVIGPATWPPILDMATHERLRAYLANPNRNTHHGVTARRHFLSGFLYCGLCRTRLFAGVTNKAPAFHCKKGQTATACGRVTVKAMPLCSLVREAVIARILIAPTLLADLSMVAATDGNDYAGDLEELRLKIRELEHARFVEGVVSRVSFMRLKAELDAQVDAIYRRLSTRQTQTMLRGVSPDALAIGSAWDERGLDWQRALLDALVERIDIAPAAYKGARFHLDRVTIRWQA